MNFTRHDNNFTFCREMFVVASNLSPEVSVLRYSRDDSSLTILEPEDALKLPIDAGLIIITALAICSSS